jgi:AcrR family transcriptional regulator
MYDEPLFGAALRSLGWDCKTSPTDRSTSTDDLMRAMEVGRQSMYDTFGDKRALFLKAGNRAGALGEEREKDRNGKSRQQARWVYIRLVTHNQRRGYFYAVAIRAKVVGSARLRRNRILMLAKHAVRFQAVS